MTIEQIINIIHIPDYFCLEDCQDGADFAFQLDRNNITYEYGASKLVLFPDNSNKIIKIPFSHEEPNFDENNKLVQNELENYCELEYDFYCDAIDAGLDKMFTEIEFGGRLHDGTSFYLAEKVAILEDIWGEPTPSKDSLLRARDLKSTHHSTIDSKWLALSLDYWGEEMTNKLLNFIEEHNINDLTSNNVGIRPDGSPVLTDFSGFSY